MTTIDDGGAAFPFSPPAMEDGASAPGYPYPELGMNLRDWFAGQALGSIPLRSWDGVAPPEEIPAAWARLAYQVADAMIAARKVGDGS